MMKSLQDWDRNRRAEQLAEAHPDAEIRQIDGRPHAKAYKWNPRPDITTYELALCVGVIVNKYSPSVESLPPEAKRHFEVRWNSL